MTTTRRTFLEAASLGAAALALDPELLAAAPRLAAPLAVGIVGCGRQSRAILSELRKFEDVSLAAVCDIDERRLAAATRRAGGAASFASHVEMLEKASLDAVVVATPTHLHEGPALDALAAGKHVYCEGPLSADGESARRIAKAAGASRQVFHVGMQGRSDPVYGLARSFTLAGAIRDLVLLRAQDHSKNSWRASESGSEHDWRLDPKVSTGLLGELATHQLDVLHWFTDQVPSAVRARGGVLAWRDGRVVADTVCAEFSFDGGLTLLWDGTLGNSYEGRYELLAGTLGTVKLAWTHGWMFKEADAPTQGWEVYANRQRFHDDEGITLIAEATKLAAQGKLQEGVGLPNPPLYYALADFLKSATESQTVACTAIDGLRAVALAEHARRALDTGERVEIPASAVALEPR